MVSEVVSRVVGHALAAAVAVAVLWLPGTLLVGEGWRRLKVRAGYVCLQVVAVTTLVVAEPVWMRPIHEVGGSVAMPYLWRIAYRLDTNLVVYASIIGLIWAAERYRRHAAVRLTVAEMDAAATQAKLYALSLQLQPHFLFNTLNLISQLAYENMETAERILADLRGLLTQSLECSHRRAVTVREELQLLDAYLAIQRQRFHERVRVSVRVADDILDAAVPPLLFQPLVENAIQHGIGDRPSGGQIEVVASHTGDRVSLRICDDGVGVECDSMSEGLGLTNTRKRLEQLFHNDCSLTLEARPNGGTTVEITLPFRRASETPAHEESMAPPREGASRSIRDVVDPHKAAGWFSTSIRVVAAVVGAVVVCAELAVAARIAPLAAPWHIPVGSMLVNALLWAALTLPTIWIARRLDLAEGRVARRVGGHALCAVAVSVVHLSLWLSILALADPSEFGPTRAHALAWGIWDIVIYATLTAFSVVASLGRLRRGIQRAVTNSRSRLARARVDTLRLQLQPSIMLGGLDAIASRIRIDPASGEQAIACMGTVLRMLLRNGGRQLTSLQNEIELLEAHGELMGADCTRFGITLVPACLTNAQVPTLLLLSLLQSIRGRLSDIEVSEDGASLMATLMVHRSGGEALVLDEEGLKAIRVRLGTHYVHRWALGIDVTGANQIAATVRIPLQMATPDNGDNLDDDETQDVHLAVA